MARTPQTSAVPTEKRAVTLAAELRERILRGEFDPGDSLPIEAELMEQLGASRFVIREAMRLLEAEGFLKIRRGPGGGPKVRHPSIDVAAHAVGVQFLLLEVPLLDIWQVRTELIAESIRELATPAPEQLTRLEVLVARLAGAENDDTAFQRGWIELTEALADLGTNRARAVIVKALHGITHSQVMEATRLANEVKPREKAEEVKRGYRRDLVASFAAIVQAIAAGDSDVAATRFREQSEHAGTGMATTMGGTALVDLFARSTGGNVPAENGADRSDVKDVKARA